MGTTAITVISGFLPPTTADKETFASVYTRASRGAWRRVDGIGARIILVASIFFFVLEEADTRFARASAVMIAFLVLSIVLWVLFSSRSKCRGSYEQSAAPILPIRLLKRRHVSAMMLYGFFTGFPFMGDVVNLP